MPRGFLSWQANRKAAADPFDRGHTDDAAVAVDDPLGDRKPQTRTLCAGIAYGADDILNGNSKMIIRFDDNDVSVTDWYDLTTTNAEQIRFYKNGRIDVRFKDSAAAGNCFKRLRLDEITQREN